MQSFITFNNELLNIFYGFLFVRVACHLRYTFLMSIWVDESISSYVMKQNKFPDVLLCHVKYTLYTNMSCQNYLF